MLYYVINPTPKLDLREIEGLHPAYAAGIEPPHLKSSRRITNDNWSEASGNASSVADVAHCDTSGKRVSHLPSRLEGKEAAMTNDQAPNDHGLTSDSRHDQDEISRISHAGGRAQRRPGFLSAPEESGAALRSAAGVKASAELDDVQIERSDGTGTRLNVEIRDAFFTSIS